jgi:hypothetical protein
MANITISDLREDRTLDRAAMAHICGADGAPWVFGWMRAFMPNQRAMPFVINFYQINNYADQMINQVQLVDVNNTAPNSAINVGVDGRSINNGQIE